MEVKEAVSLAKQYVSDILHDEAVSSIGLEEVEFDDAQHAWRVTIGFTRPFDYVTSATDILTGNKTLKRTYKVLLISDAGRSVISFKNRDRTDD